MSSRLGTHREHDLYFLALATDYDGTIAHHGVVDANTCEALQRFKATGRRLILVTGRDLDDLKRVFPAFTLYDRIVAENGAVIYDPATGEERVIAPAPPPAFIEALTLRKVAPLAVGRCIVATWEPNETTVLEVIRDLGLELQIIFNKGAVMVLPPGMNKAAGLAAALRDLDLSPPNVVGVGDAENDHAFLRFCGCDAAVGNALQAVKDEADIQLVARYGDGVIELIEMILRDDGRVLRPHRHGILVGTDRTGAEVYLEPYGGGVLIAGSSGVGKSTLATALTERMVEKAQEFCVFDPEGDYDELEHAMTVGDARNAPNVDEVVAFLRKRVINVVVNTQALSAEERPGFFARLLPEVSSLRARTGRPHWLIVDEAHHLLAASREDIAQVIPERLTAVIFVTVHPDALSSVALRGVEVVVAMGNAAAETIAQFCRASGAALPAGMPAPGSDEVLVWVRDAGVAPRAVKALRPRQSRRRHRRKYAEGDVGEGMSFYFRGPDNALNLRAQNLLIFSQIAAGVDEGTWEHHRRAGDYSTWFKTVIKDDELAREAADAERNANLDANASRSRILAAITRRYTAAAR